MTLTFIQKLLSSRSIIGGKSNMTTKTPLLDNTEQSIDEVDHVHRLTIAQIQSFESNYISRPFSELNPWWEFLRSDSNIRLHCRNSISEFLLKTYSTLLRSDRIVFIPSRDIDVIIAIRIPYLNRRVFCKFEIYNINHICIHKGPTITLTAQENLQYVNSGKPAFNRLIQEQNNTVAIHFLDDEPPPIPSTFEILGLTLAKTERNIVLQHPEKFSTDYVNKNYSDKILLVKNPIHKKMHEKRSVSSSGVKEMELINL